MVCSLRFAMKNIIGEKKSYLHYYNRFIKDYEKGLCDFDIRKYVRIGMTTTPCPVYVNKSGFCKRVCKTVTDIDSFTEKVKSYYENVILPIQEIKHNRSIARRAFIKKHGFITQGNIFCRKAEYNCSKCLNKKACEIAMPYTKCKPQMVKMTKMMEILWGNLENPNWKPFIK